VLAPGEPAAVARLYDFAAPELLTELQHQLLDSGFASFARQVGLQITAKTRVVVGLEYASFVLTPYSALADRLEAERSGFIFCSMEGAAAGVVYQIPTAEALLWTSRMVGGTGRLPLPDRTLTAVERALMWRMADEHLGELRLALGGLLPEITVDSFAYTLTRDVAPPDELMIVASFRLRRAGAEAPIALAIPAGPVLAALGRSRAAEQGAAVTERLEQHLAASPVEVALRFDETRVGPGIVLSLKEDDLILLGHPQHRPLSVMVEGTPIVRAAVGVQGERLACVVVEFEEAS
jgi:flagellar motor switch protein FliM